MSVEQNPASTIESNSQPVITVMHASVGSGHKRQRMPLLKPSISCAAPMIFQRTSESTFWMFSTMAALNLTAIKQQPLLPGPQDQFTTSPGATRLQDVFYGAAVPVGLA